VSRENKGNWGDGVEGQTEGWICYTLTLRLTVESGGVSADYGNRLRSLGRGTIEKPRKKEGQGRGRCGKGGETGGGQAGSRGMSRDG